MFDLLVYFLYGWLFGAIAVPLCYLYGFDNLARFVPITNSVLLFLYTKLSGHDAAAILRAETNYHNSILGDISLSTLDSQAQGVQLRQEEKEKEIKGQQQTNNNNNNKLGVSPVRLTSVCQMSSYTEGGIIGNVRECRLVLFDSHLMVYEVGASQNIGTHDRVITCERIIGKIQTNRISVRAAFIEPGNRRGTGSTILQGHVLLMSACDNFPLFDGDKTCLSEFFPSNMTITSSTLEERGIYRGVHATSWNSNSNSKGSYNKKNKKNNNNNNNNSKSASSVIGDSESDWRSSSRDTLAIKFYYAREQERWLNLLQGPEEAAYWRNYLQTHTTPDAFNLFLTRILFQNMRTTALANYIRAKIQRKFYELSIKKFPREIEGDIILDDFILGNEVPIFSNISPPSLAAKGEMILEFDLLYRGGATLCLRLNLTYRGIRIPHIVFSIKIIHLSSRLRVSVGPPPSKKFWVGGLTPADIKLEVHQGIASGKGLLHRILTSLPDLSSMVTNFIKLYLLHDMVLPVMDDFPLPNVAKTPPVSPKTAARKTWKKRFNRHDAAAHSRGKVGETNINNNNNNDNNNDTDTGRKSSIHHSKSKSPQPTPPLSEESDEIEFMQTGNGSTFTQASTSQCVEESQDKSSRNYSVAMHQSTFSSLPLNSEDARRHRLKTKAREIMREAVSATIGLPVGDKSQERDDSKDK